MHITSTYHTDVGIQKTNNQDSLLLQQADGDFGSAMLAVLCDGLGGLEKGEVASAAVVRAFSNWFQHVYPQLLKKQCGSRELLNSWSQLVSSMNRSIADYGEKYGITLGTTLEALLLMKDKYYIFHIGDCRIYLKEKMLKQLTKDQTFIQRQMDLGAMTVEQALKDPRRNTLLQCIGASQYIEPDFIEGKLMKGQSFLICSDGFRHMLSSEELSDSLELPTHFDEKMMKDRLIQLTDICKRRGENDNITSIWIRID